RAATVGLEGDALPARRSDLHPQRHAGDNAFKLESTFRIFVERACRDGGGEGSDLEADFFTHRGDPVTTGSQSEGGLHLEFIVVGRGTPWDLTPRHEGCEIHDGRKELSRAQFSGDAKIESPRNGGAARPSRG